MRSSISVNVERLRNTRTTDSLRRSGTACFSIIWQRACALFIGVAALAANAQSLRVYSEFTRIDPFGEVAAPDRGAEPREILSPALPRNATTGFHLVVSGDAGAEYTLHIGQNPEDATALKLYREKYVRRGQSWIPDGLDAVELPYQGRLGTADIPDQTAQAFWLDLHVAREAEVRRLKIEPSILVGERWIRYPMEARIVVTAAPATSAIGSYGRAPIEAPSDFTARRALKKRLCGFSEKFASRTALTIRDLIARDAAQDVAMASVIPDEQIWESTGAADHGGWCKSEQPHSQGPEWYLRLRDRIVGARQ